MKIEQDELNIYGVEALHKELLEEFEKGNVSVDMTTVRKVDMSILQLFLSTQKNAVKESKSFELTNLSYEVKQIIMSTGVAPLLLRGECGE